MRYLTRAFRRALWWAGACVLLVAPLASAAEGSLAADFDGDGRHDQVLFDHREPALLRVWLSRTGTTAVVRSRAPILRIAAADLDGDRHSELIIAARGHGLQVWTRRRAGFRLFQPHSSPTGRLTPAGHRALDDGPTQAPMCVAGDAAPQFASLRSIDPRAPSAAAQRVDSHADAQFAHSLPLALVAPRPPPFAC